MAIEGSIRQSALDLYAAGVGMYEIERRLSVGHSTIQRWRHAAGMPRQLGKPSVRRYTINEHAFDRVTPDACYWLGFLYADGYLGHGKHHGYLQLVLSTKDREHVAKFAQFLDTNKPLKPNDNYKCGLLVDSIVLCDRLRTLGLGGPKKDRVAPPILASSSDFWRGVRENLLHWVYQQESI